LPSLVASVTRHSCSIRPAPDNAVQARLWLEPCSEESVIDYARESHLPLSEGGDRHAAMKHVSASSELPYLYVRMVSIVVLEASLAKSRAVFYLGAISSRRALAITKRINFRRWISRRWQGPSLRCSNRSITSSCTSAGAASSDLVLPLRDPSVWYYRRVRLSITHRSRETRANNGAQRLCRISAQSPQTSRPCVHRKQH